MYRKIRIIAREPLSFPFLLPQVIIGSHDPDTVYPVRPPVVRPPKPGVRGHTRMWTPTQSRDRAFPSPRGVSRRCFVVAGLISLPLRPHRCRPLISPPFSIVCDFKNDKWNPSGGGGAGLALSLGTLRRASLRRVRQAPVPLRRRRTPLPAPPHQRCSPFSPARVASPKRFSAQRRLGNPSVHIRGSDFPRSSFFLLPQAKRETCAGWAADAITCASELVQHPLVLKCCCAMCYSVLFYFHLLLRCMYRPHFAYTFI